jgi:RHS repeat-associated protein
MLLTFKQEMRWSGEEPQTNPSVDGYVLAISLSEGYTYDAMNNLLSKTDRNQHTVSYGYDPLYRLTSKTYPDQTAVGYTYDALSRLTQVTDPSGTYGFTYDNLGRLLGTGTQYSFLSGTLTNSYGYDAASNRTSFTNPESGITNYEYDSLNRLTNLEDFNSANFGFGYDVLGRRTSLTRPNGVDTSYSYDNLSRLLSVLHNGGTLPGSTSYVVDAAGNRTSKTALQQADPNPVSVTSNYTYDNIYQLTQAVVGGNLAESFTYDAVGNRLTSVSPASYSYNSSNQLTSTSAATYTYDYNGNTTSKTDTNGTTYYTWDYENRLTSVTLPGQGGTVYFNYDPMGRRIRKVFGSVTTIYAYDGDDITEELDSGGNLVAHYTQGDGIDEPLALTGTGGTYYYHADGLGSITSLTNGSGQLAASYVYDSFGKLTTSTGTITNPFQYTGREFDTETGLYYYRARFYDPKAGRFVSEDPIRFAGGINFYSYVENEPVSLVDPYGNAPCCGPDGYRDATPAEAGKALKYAKRYQGHPYREDIPGSKWKLDCIHLVAMAIHETIDPSFPYPGLNYSAGTFEKNGHLRNLGQNELPMAGDISQFKGHVGFYDPEDYPNNLYSATLKGVKAMPQDWFNNLMGYLRIRVPCK